ncbi:hypothetical protein AB7M42_008480 [Bradyrhizobium diazoefficiens]
MISGTRQRLRFLDFYAHLGGGLVPLFPAATQAIRLNPR